MEEALDRLQRRREEQKRKMAESAAQSQQPPRHVQQACTLLTPQVIEAVCQSLIAAAAGQDSPRAPHVPGCDNPEDPVKDVLEEFALCLQDIFSASLPAMK